MIFFGQEVTILRGGYRLWKLWFHKVKFA